MRPPEVFVRPLLHEEAVRLKRLSKRAKHQCTRQRAAVLLASNVRMSASQIAEMWHTDPSWVRKVIHEFNERGMDSLRPRYRGGRPRRITTDQRQQIISVAGARPDHQGVPLTRWSLPRLSCYLADEGIVEVSPRHLGALLAEANLSFQRTRTWKASPDPDYEAKTARMLALCESPPPDGAVVSFDQMGPVSLRPTAGAGWALKGRPERQRADYNRRAGTRYVFGAFDVHDDRLRVRLRPRRRGSDMLAFMAQIRGCYPRRQRIYWIQDNLSANWTPDIRAYADTNNDRARRDPNLRQLPEPRRVPLLGDQPVRRRATPTTSTGTRSRSRSPATSPTATAITATAASPQSKPASASPPDMPLRVQPNLKGH